MKERERVRKERGMDRRKAKRQVDRLESFLQQCTLFVYPWIEKNLVNLFKL